MSDLPLNPSESFRRLNPGLYGDPTRSEPVERERDLHDDIMTWCKSQWPQIKFRHARMDRATTEELGCEDFTLFLPEGRVAHIECKKKGQKQTQEQLAWACQLGRLGHKVSVVTNMEEFLLALVMANEK